LGKIVNERTEEVQIQKQEILERNEELLQNNEEISAQKEEMILQKELLEMQYKATQDSIRYAKTIQNAILPLEENIAKKLNAFILFRPKSIVSGDFYWFANLTAKEGFSEKTFLATVDCTGHGVPGAFMSMIGSRLLNEIVNERHITNTDEILTALHKGIIKSLKQEQTDNPDGMDICLCRFEKNDENTDVYFSGAKRPLLYKIKEQSSVLILKGDRKSIGGIKKTKREVEFTEQKITLRKGDSLYLTSDGYADQCNQNREKIGRHSFENLILENADKPVVEQNIAFNNFLDSYKNTAEQRDDITVIGIKL